MEAGEIEFRSGRTDRGYVRFEIETWARSGGSHFRVLYDALPLAREAQAYMWSHFCARAPKLAGGIVMSNVSVNTERLEIEVVGASRQPDQQSLRATRDRRGHPELEDHLERGQMDFEVRKWTDGGAVEFRIHAHSQRAHIDNPFVRIGLWVFGRTLQRRFATRALRRMRHLVDDRVSQQQRAA